MSPFDPLFLVLSYLSILPSHFVSYSDLWESISQHRFNPPVAKGEKESKDEEDALFSDDIIELSRLECVKARLEKVCETQSKPLSTISPQIILELNAFLKLQSTIQRLSIDSPHPSSSKYSKPKSTHYPIQSMVYSVRLNRQIQERGKHPRNKDYKKKKKEELLELLSTCRNLSLLFREGWGEKGLEVDKG